MQRALGATRLVNKLYRRLHGDDIPRQPGILHNPGAVDLGEEQFGHLRQPFLRLDGKISDPFSVGFPNLDDPANGEDLRLSPHERGRQSASPKGNYTSLERLQDRFRAAISSIPGSGRAPEHRLTRPWQRRMEDHPS